MDPSFILYREDTHPTFFKLFFKIVESLFIGTEKTDTYFVPGGGISA